MIKKVASPGNLSSGEKMPLLKSGLKKSRDQVILIQVKNAASQIMTKKVTSPGIVEFR